ncbi:MAG TPA: SusC/RagA family TonB-linked outer membrane protein [Gemmatimonadaceae bacterium]|nr:SusC/RagA family TonB-linked outer membrane protein [Gemmatimonadaceae bacterium]
MTSRVRSTCRASIAAAHALAVASMMVLGGTRLSAQQPPTGAIEGRVTEAGTGRPLGAAQVVVAGTTVGAATNDAGNYRIANAPARQVELRVRLIGFAPLSKTVVVTAGQTVRADFQVQVSALQLEQIVVTGSGQQVEVKKLGNTVAVIQPPANAPISDVSSLLTAREPGLSAIAGSGLSGEGARIRIRGNASLTQSNEPVFFIDGVRMNSGGTMTSRIDDIDPNSIERIEVLKGAAAATLYGTEASNGVIQIFTKKGTMGAPKWTVQVDQEAIAFPDRLAPNAGYARSQAQADSLSTYWRQPGLKAFQVFEVPIFKDYLTETGSATSVSGSVSGGASMVNYFASGRYQDEDGAIGGEDFGPARDGVKRIQSGLNLSLVPFNSLRLGVRNSYYNIKSERPGDIIGNSIYGAFALSQYARPELANCNKSTYVAPGKCSGPGNPFGNQAFMTMREAMQQVAEETVSRYNGAFSATYSPFSELNADVTLGYDITNRRNFTFSYYRYDVDEFTTNNPEGSRAIGSSQNRVLTLDSKLAWNRPITSSLTSGLVVGVQVFNDRGETSTGSALDLPGPGIEVVGAGGRSIATSETFATGISGGYFAQEQLGYHDWVFLTLGGRYDFASAFGEESPGVFYPKASLSVVPSDLGGWSSPFGINTLRLRFAMGQSGRAPGGFDKFTTFAPLRAETGAGLAPSQLGNQSLEPEISTEIEGGFEMGLFADRLGINATIWSRTVKDLLIDQQFAPSGGFRNAQIANIGQMEGSGYEFGARAFVLSTPRIGVELFANAAYLKQTITSLGPDLTRFIKVDPGYIRHLVYLRRGDPLGSLYAPRLASACPGGGTTPGNNPAGKAVACYGPNEVPINLNNNGRAATKAELLAYLAQARDLKTSAVQNALRPLLADYDGTGRLLEQKVGDIIPDWTGSFGGTATMFRNWRAQALFEWRTGFQLANLTDAFRSSQHATIGSNTRGYSEIEATLVNPASTAEQRLAAAETYIKQYRRLLEPGLSEIQDGDFVRLRELALTYTAPARIASRVRASSLAITAAGRNLWLATKYDGADPELSYAGRQPGGGTLANFRDASEAFGLPVPRRFSLQINLGF